MTVGWNDGHTDRQNGISSHLLIFTKECYKNLTNLKITKNCISSTISNSLSLAIVSLSLIYKIPQILKIIEKKSSRGMSWFSVFLDIVSLSCTIGYFFTLNFPLMNYGEMISNIIQTEIIFVIIYFYKGLTTKKFLITTIFNFVFLALIFNRMLPMVIVKAFLGFSSFLFCFSRGSQIYEILKISFSGSMSIITVFMGFAGILARTFTIWVDTDDMFLLMTQLVQCGFSGVMFCCVVMYRNAPVEKKNK